VELNSDGYLNSIDTKNTKEARPKSETEIANIGAVIEANFKTLSDPNNLGNYRKAIEGIAGLPSGCRVLETWEYKYAEGEKFHKDGSPNYKAITIMDASGNIFIHFNGTGDGNWPYNAVAFGGDPSPMQIAVIDHFEDMVKKYFLGKANGKLYVTGHSQGGNNAKFVTMRSTYGEHIQTCVSLDGPKFSTKFINDTEELYKKQYPGGRWKGAYENRCKKIYAYNGENDYVSALGQKDVVPEGHVRYIEYTGKSPFDAKLYHDTGGLLNEDEKITLIKDDSAFRKFVTAVNGRILKLPQGQQARLAEVVMKICENKISGAEQLRRVNLNNQELKGLVDLMVPELLNLIGEYSQIAIAMLQQMGVAQGMAKGFCAVASSLPENEAIELLAFAAIVALGDSTVTLETIKDAVEAAGAIGPMLETTLFETVKTASAHFAQNVAKSFGVLAASKQPLKLNTKGALGNNPVLKEFAKDNKNTKDI
jgi:hypothetical protein